MFLDAFHTANDQIICITPDQASQFAKQVCDDFNPLHNPDNKRFLIPGDLLFSLTLNRLGLRQNMAFKFTGMLGKESQIIFPVSPENEMEIKDGNDKTCIEISANGEISENSSVIESFIKSYVAFSGHSFPHLLVPLMQENQMMINPARPMVMYESMGFEFETMDLTQPVLEFSSSQLEVNGKRGTVTLNFDILDDETKVGSGYKTMLLSGLRDYDQNAIDALIETYENEKSAYFS